MRKLVASALSPTTGSRRGHGTKDTFVPMHAVRIFREIREVSGLDRTVAATIMAGDPGKGQ